MIDQLDDQLSTWVTQTVGGIQPTLAAPSDGDGGLGINLYLLELVNEPLRQHTGRPHVQPALRYLVTVTAAEPKDAHRLLGALLHAALEHPDFEVELEPIPSHFWTAFHIVPRPAFVLRLPWPREWPASTAPLVQAPPSLVSGGLAPFYGQVRGPGATPLANARITVPNLDRHAVSDAQGRFTLAGLPTAPRPKTLQITARGHTTIVTVTEQGSPDAPVQLAVEIGNNNN